MAENEQRPVQEATFELPFSGEAKKAGATDTIVEMRRPGISKETKASAFVKAMSRIGRSMQEPRGVAAQGLNRTGLGQERAKFEAEKQQREAQTSATAQRENAENIQLLQEDRKYTEKALETHRAELKNIFSGQAEPIKSNTQDKNEGTNQSAKEEAQEPKTTKVYLTRKGDGWKNTLTLPKNYTRQDLTRAIQGLGGEFTEYEAGYDWKTPQGLRTLFKDILIAATKAAQTSTAPSYQKPLEKNERTKEKTQDQETETVKFYSTKDGHELFTLQLPKGGKYTTADVNRALNATGRNFTYTPAWTPGGWHIRGRDIWQAVKKVYQASASQSSEPPSQKVA